MNDAYGYRLCKCCKSILSITVKNVKNLYWGIPQLLLYKELLKS